MSNNLEKKERRNTDTKTKRDQVDYARNLMLFENTNSSSIRWLTTKEAAEYLRTNPKQIRNWVYQGKVSAYRLLGKSLRFRADELAVLIKGGTAWE